MPRSAGEFNVFRWQLCILQVPSRVEPVLADKEVLLTALNIKAMSFSPDDSVDSNGEAIASKRTGSGNNGGGGGAGGTGSASSKGKTQKMNSILGNLVDADSNVNGDLSSNRPVNMIVDLAFASNVRFLDDHELHLDNVELYKVSPWQICKTIAQSSSICYPISDPPVRDRPSVGKRHPGFINVDDILQRFSFASYQGLGDR